MTLAEIITRLEEIRSQVATAEKPEDFQAEIDELEARKAELEAIETRKKNAEALQAGAATPEKKTTPTT